MLKVPLVVMLALVVNTQQDNKAGDQLVEFRKKHRGPVGILSTTSGAPIDRKEAGSTLNTNLMRNQYVMETLSHFVRERIPLRPVHAMGAGAFGYFITTHDISHICKADFLSRVGKVTPIAARFSLSNTERGGPDLFRDTRGYAVKFYTTEGNFDIVGFNTPMFLVKDPSLFVTTVHMARKNPATDFLDVNMIWDFVAQNPESIFIFLHIFGHQGLPNGYRHMPGFSIHAYPLYNANGTITYARWRFNPLSGIKSVNSSEAIRLGARDPSYNARDLYNAIADGDYPSWEVSLQLMTQEDVNKAPFDPFDLTKVIPESQVPWTPIGKIVLKKNPKNYFAEVEQMAFCPSNLVPGIEGAPDKIFEARTLFYKDAHRHRIGTNHYKIPVNCPYRSKYGHTYLRDGVPPVNDNQFDAPNYYRNSFNGPVPYVEENRPVVPVIHEELANNFEQANDYYKNQLTSEQQSELIVNIVTSVCRATNSVQDNLVIALAKVSSDLSKKVAAGLDAKNCKT